MNDKEKFKKAKKKLEKIETTIKPFIKNHKKTEIYSSIGRWKTYDEV